MPGIAGASRLESLARRQWGKIAVVAMPFLVALTNGTWLTSAMGDVDSWTYNGYFKALRAFAANRAAWGPANYFETRLPVIVPGALAYGLLPDAVARVVLNLCILHTSIALSFWYVVRTHLSRAAATLATVMLVTDIFYLRTIGWDYVDNGALAYQAITFALLTRAPHARRPQLCLAASGFTATSMVTAHFSAAVMVPVLAAYALYMIRVANPRLSRSDVLRRLPALAAWGAVGAAACLLLYGLVSRLFLAGPFLFFVEQLRAAGRVDTGHYAAKARIFSYGYWLAVHAAVLVASVGALFIHYAVRRARRPLSGFARFCLWTAVALYLVVIGGELLQRTIYMARSGLYATNFLLVAYLAVAALLFDKRRISPGVGSLIFAVFPCALMAKLALHDGLGLTLRFPQPMFAIAVVMAASMLVAFAVERTTALIVATLVLAACSLLLPRRFERDDAILAARSYILANAAPPRVFYSDDDPQSARQLISIASALTDHVVHERGAGSRPIEPGDRIALLESQLASDVAPGGDGCAIEGLEPIGDRIVPGRYFDTAIHLFEATRAAVRHADVRCRLRSHPDPRFSPLLRLNGSIRLAAGVYEVTFHYAATSTQHWEIVGNEASSPRRIGQGALPDTAGEPRTLSIAFRLPVPIADLEARTIFAGSGKLSMTAVVIAGLKAR